MKANTAKKRTIGILAVFGLLFLGFTAACSSPESSKSPSGNATTPGAPATVNLLVLDAHVTAPVKTAAPDTADIETSQYTGTVAWQTSDGTALSGSFAKLTVYQAVVKLQAKGGFTFTGVAADSFSYTGATSVANNADEGTV